MLHWKSAVPQVRASTCGVRRPTSPTFCIYFFPECPRLSAHPVWPGVHCSTLVGVTVPQGHSWEPSEPVVLVAILLVYVKATVAKELTVTANCLSISNPSLH